MPPTTNGSAQLCAVCDQPAKSRCGGCKRVPFCSPRCQKLIWSTHKALCKADPDVFHPPPLSARELGDLRPLMNELRVTDRSTRPSSFMQEVREYYGSSFSQEVRRNRAWLEALRTSYRDLRRPQTLTAILTTPTPPETSDSPLWGQREHLLRLAREVLDACYIGSTGGRRDHLNDPRQRNPWQEFQPVLLECAASLQTDPRDNRSPAEVSLQMMRLFNSFLRQAIIYINLQMETIQEEDNDKGPELMLTTIAAGRRLKKVFEEDVVKKPGTTVAVPIIIGTLVEELTANFEMLGRHIALEVAR
ncbi:putative Microtubule-associated protein [Rhodotorula toruloides]|nr:putative Microtubule-associated protein [Rhodotorula toruloides]